MNILLSIYPIEIQEIQSIPEKPVCACFASVNQLFYIIPLQNPLFPPYSYKISFTPGWFQNQGNKKRPVQYRGLYCKNAETGKNPILKYLPPYKYEGKATIHSIVILLTLFSTFTPCLLLFLRTFCSESFTVLNFSHFTGCILKMRGCL